MIVVSDAPGIPIVLRNDIADELSEGLVEVMWHDYPSNVKLWQFRSDLIRDGF